MADRVVGVHLAGNVLRGVEVAHGRPVRAAQVELPAGAVAAGEVVDAKAVRTALRQLWKQGRFRTRRVVLGVAHQRVVVRQAELPPLATPMLRDALRYEVAELVPFPLDTALLDHHVIDEVEDENGRRRLHVLAVAAVSGAIKPWVSAASSAQLKVVAVDVAAFGLVRAACALPDTGTTEPFVGATADAGEGTGSPAPSGTDAAALTLAPAPSSASSPAASGPTGVAVVELLEGAVTITVHAGGVPRFVRLVNGLDATSVMLTAELEAELSRIERYRRRSDEQEPVEIEETTVTTPSRRNPIVEAVRTSLDYYATQLGAIPVRRLVLTGDRQLAADLEPMFAESIPIPSSYVAPAETLLPERRRAAVPAGISLSSLSTPYGLALRGDDGAAGPHRLSLLPPNVIAARRRRKELAACGVTLLATAGVLGVLTVQTRPDTSEADNARRAANHQKANIVKELVKYSDAKDLIGELTTSENTANQLLTNAIGWADLIDHLKAAAPPDGGFASFEGSRDGATGGAAAGRALGSVKIEVTGQGASALGSWLTALSSVTYVRDMWPGSTSAISVDGIGSLSFSGTITDQALTKRTFGGDPSAPAAGGDATASATTAPTTATTPTTPTTGGPPSTGAPPSTAGASTTAPPSTAPPTSATTTSTAPTSSSGAPSSSTPPSSTTVPTTGAGA